MPSSSIATTARMATCPWHLLKYPVRTPVTEVHPECRCQYVEKAFVYPQHACPCTAAEKHKAEWSYCRAGSTMLSRTRQFPTKNTQHESGHAQLTMPDKSSGRPALRNGVTAWSCVHQPLPCQPYYAQTQLIVHVTPSAPPLCSCLV